MRTVGPGAWRDRLRRLHDDDRGTTLMEVVVGMALLSIFMAMFTGALVLISSNVDKVAAVTASSGQLNDAFLRLDRDLRYATAISEPGRSASGDWYVEYEFVSARGVQTCAQLRTTGDQLQYRNAPAGTPDAPAFIALASHLTNGTVPAGSADQPFTSTADGSGPNQQLLITLRTASGTSTPAPARTALTFTALNSSASAAAAPVCSELERE